MAPRKFRFMQGGYYHIYNRGAARQSIFKSEENYLYLLNLLKKIAAESAVTVIAYCLLPNHYHWLLRQDGEIAAGKVPTRVFGSYSQAYNKAHERTGTLFEGPYQCIVVESDEYIRHLCRYIHANPVRHRLADAPDLWSYSNYLEWIEKRPGTLVDHSFIKAHFSKAEEYIAYVNSYLIGHVKLPEALHNYLEGL